MSTSPQGPAPAPADHAADPAAIAAAFVGARRAARALPDFPGRVPASLAAGYAVQDQAIARWPDTLVGWKVGYIAPARRDASGEDRLVGPIFSRAVWPLADGGTLDVPVFAGGFAAVEAEYVFVLAADAPPDRLAWDEDAAAALVGSLHIGIETAGSPLATINQLGPTVVVSDFGNNHGLVLGPEIPDWRARSAASLRCATSIEGRLVGEGGADAVPGGLLAAFAFALGRCARRGLPLRRGMLVSTGAATGIHDILPGESARIDFAGDGVLACRAVAATPDPDA